MLALAGEDREPGAFVFRVGMGVDVAQIHFRRCRRQGEKPLVRAGNTGDIARRLRSDTSCQPLFDQGVSQPHQ